jgi:plastocyanin
VAPAEKKSSAQKASPTEEPEGQLIQVGQITFSTWGDRDARGQASRGLDAGDFYFKGTFLHGQPGQKLTLQIRNVEDQVHNFSLPAQNINQEIPPDGERVNVDVNFPQSGGLQFFCKYHTAQGMNGLLLVGDATPQSFASSQPASSPQPSPSPRPAASPQPGG